MCKNKEAVEIVQCPYCGEWMNLEQAEDEEPVDYCHHDILPMPDFIKFNDNEGFSARKYFDGILS